MICVIHVVVGAMGGAVAQRVTKKIRKRSLTYNILVLSLISLLAFGSHFILDHIQHYDYPFAPDEVEGWTGVFSDTSFSILSICLALGLIYWRQVWQKRFILWCGFLGILPDVIVFGLRHSSAHFAHLFIRFHRWCHASSSLNITTGMIEYLFIYIICFAILYYCEHPRGS